MVLYINGNYPHHSLHGELVSKLADLGHEICVYVPVKGTELKGKYDHRKSGVALVYSDVLTTADRVFFLKKALKLAKDIEEKVDMRKIDCILAGTIYSDGVPAYFLSKKYGIPFTVAVRDTDINTHMKWRPYLDGLIKKVLDASLQIVCIAPAYQKQLEKYEIEANKYVSIPNAINDFWFSSCIERRSLHRPISLIYVGEISGRKNVKTSIQVIHDLNADALDSELHIIGSGDEEQACRQLAVQLGIENKIHFHGWKNGVDVIKSFYDQADIFVMPSITETFGTVYIEALSQGLPLIYTKGQGVDGYFEQGEVGYACEPTNVNVIGEAIRMIIKEYANISQHCISNSIRFKWDVVASEYSNLINNMKEKRNV